MKVRNKMQLTEEQQIKVHLTKLFCLKCVPLDKEVIDIFTNVIINDDKFIASDIEKACKDIARRLINGRLEYYYIYENALKYKKERIERQQSLERRQRLRLENDEEKAWSNMSEKERKEYLDKVRK